MASHKRRNGVFISIWWNHEMLKTRKKVDKDKASPPTPNKRKEKENKASPPTPLLGEGSDMFSNCILFAFYFQGILLPSLWRGAGGEALFSFSFLLFGIGGEASLSLLYTYCLITFPCSLTFTKRRKQV